MGVGSVGRVRVRSVTVGSMRDRGRVGQWGSVLRRIVVRPGLDRCLVVNKYGFTNKSRAMMICSRVVVLLMMRATMITMIVMSVMKIRMDCHAYKNDRYN